MTLLPYKAEFGGKVLGRYATLAEAQEAINAAEKAAMPYLVTRYDFQGDKAYSRAPVEFADVEEARRYCKLVRAAIAKWGDNSGASLTDRRGNNIKVEDETMTTLKDAQAKAREIGMTITSRPEDGEYVVNFNRRFSLPDGQQFGDEDSAYHTTDLDDALATAKAMADHARNSARR